MNTTTAVKGIRCAHCKGRHETVSGVRECWEEMAYMEWTIRSEQAAEAAATRYWEEGTEQQRMMSQWETEEDMRRSPFDPIWNN